MKRVEKFAYQLEDDEVVYWDLISRVSPQFVAWVEHYFGPLSATVETRQYWGLVDLYTEYLFDLPQAAKEPMS